MDEKDKQSEQNTNDFIQGIMESVSPNIEKTIQQQVTLTKWKIALDVVTICLVVIGATYIIVHPELLSNSVQDFCRVCEEKTGAICTSIKLR